MGDGSAGADWLRRWGPVVGGGVAAAYGVRRGSLSGLLLAAVGGYVAYRGYQAARGPADHLPPLTGRAKVLYNELGAGVNAAAYDHVTQAAKEDRAPAGTLIEDIVDEASEDSFPASDPPAYL